LGCWVIYHENVYVICKKDGIFFEANINKEKQEVEKLEPIKTKIIKGRTAYFNPQDSHHEYMVIMDDGLYIYDETGESGNDAVIWPNDPAWFN
jgi:hypothetical protein